MYNIVTKPSIINEIKKSKYWRQSLGLVTTVEHNGQRVYNDKDKFSYYYNTTYKTNIQMQGNLGHIVVYLDYYINEEVLAIYHGQEEFIFNLEPLIIKEKGIDFYLGYLLKKVDFQKEEKEKIIEEKVLEVKKEGNPDILKQNPGMATYEDIKAYLAEKNKNRYVTPNSDTI